MDLSLVIPCYNEGFRIADTIDRVTAYLRRLGKSYEIIIVDDGSGDDTLAKAKAKAEGREDIKIITYTPNKGKGNAVREGVLAAEGELIAFTDADLSAPIEELDKLLAAIDDGAAVAIGSRAVAHSEIVVHQPLYREIGGKCLNLIIQLFAVPGIRDTQCGFKIFRGAPAKRIFASSFIDGW
ncbi:MAG: glycosyltransferase family 2 protein, partial [Abditibacteriota bacterium]|nr:glycosyltransferase family 2 protein [Abditibacteriota bacterium]